MKFTESQLQAIAHDQGDLQIIACAGSGKTEVVARRVAALLKKGAQSGLAPRNIVAFTFTEKAAAELKERIVARCREELGEVHGLAEMFGRLRLPLRLVPPLALVGGGHRQLPTDQKGLSRVILDVSAHVQCYASYPWQPQLFQWIGSGVIVRNTTSGIHKNTQSNSIE
jgi:UvrD/REP helicase N-terminal domain